jgi:anti-sigma factor RsiW
MTCSPNDLKDYFFEELPAPERQLVEDHLKQCSGCREELARLRLTGSALHALRDEEPPRRIAFVSDKIFAPGWWQRFWQSTPRLGFAAAAMLAAAILVHAFVRPAAPAPAALDSAALEARISAEVARRLEPAVAAAVAAAEARQAQRAAQLVAETEQRLEFDRRADRVAFEETLSLLQKKFNVLYLASAQTGGPR